MSNEITMPKLSDTMEEGKILRWLKHPGDKIARGEAIAEVETDKADMVLESFDEGVLDQIKLNEGESAPVGAVIATMKSAGAKESKSDDETAVRTPRWKIRARKRLLLRSLPKPIAIKPKAAEKKETPKRSIAPSCRRDRRIRGRFARASCDVRESQCRADCDRRAAAASASPPRPLLTPTRATATSCAPLRSRAAPPKRPASISLTCAAPVPKAA